MRMMSLKMLKMMSLKLLKMTMQVGKIEDDDAGGKNVGGSVWGGNCGGLALEATSRYTCT